VEKVRRDAYVPASLDPGLFKMQTVLRRRPNRLPRCLRHTLQTRGVKLDVVYNPDLKRMKHLKEDGFSISTKPIIHDAEPVFRGRLQEHIRFFDKDFMHVTPEDEHVGLAIVGLHPETRKGDVRRKLTSLGTIRHCWICAYVAFHSLHSRSHHFVRQGPSLLSSSVSRTLARGIAPKNGWKAYKIIHSSLWTVTKDIGMRPHPRIGQSSALNL